MPSSTPSPASNIPNAFPIKPEDGLQYDRLAVPAELNLLTSDAQVLFDETTQMAARFLNLPICTLSAFDQDFEWVRSSVGLSRLGLMNELAATRRITYQQSLGARVVQTGRPVVIEDSLGDENLADCLIIQKYRVRAYIGVPLWDAHYCTVGVLAVMDLQPHTFCDRDQELLELLARWSMSEYERAYWMRRQTPQASSPMATVALPNRSNYARPIRPAAGQSSAATIVALSPDPKAMPGPAATPHTLAYPLQVKLLSQMTQELRTPLTSVMGMASVLSQEIYGRLTQKQKDYLGIIHQSGQYLLALVNEVVELAELDVNDTTLHLAAVDIEMLCQQAINTLEQAAVRREQSVHLTIEPGQRIWYVDRGKIRQLLYHLLFSLIQASAAGSTVRLHISRRQSQLQIATWVSHPWLGESLPYADFYRRHMSQPIQQVIEEAVEMGLTFCPIPTQCSELTLDQEWPLVGTSPTPSENPSDELRASLGILLSRYLAECHRGQMVLQGSGESGYHYGVLLPEVNEAGEQL